MKTENFIKAKALMTNIEDLEDRISKTKSFEKAIQQDLSMIQLTSPTRRELCIYMNDHTSRGIFIPAIQGASIELIETLENKIIELRSQLSKLSDNINAEVITSTDAIEFADWLLHMPNVDLEMYHTKVHFSEFIHQRNNES